MGIPLRRSILIRNIDEGLWWRLQRSKTALQCRTWAEYMERVVEMVEITDPDSLPERRATRKRKG